MTLIERIKQKCKEQNLTIKGLEEKAGFSNATIRKWETQKPSYDKVVTVANCLNVSLNWLILGKESEELTPDEQELIDRYRMSDQRGKRNIMITAKAETENSKSYICPTGGGTGTGSL